jgi:cell division ATPase FtsA
MFDETNIIAGLEIGTAKVCVVVGEHKADGSVNIIGIGQAPSRGVRKGEIINPQEVEEDVRVAVAEAEQMADVEIRSVYLAVTGGHIQGFNNRGFHRVFSPDHEITAEDVEVVLENAKAINLSLENSLILNIRQHFVVDDHGLEIKQVKAEHVQMITALRLEEVFRVIAEELEHGGLTQQLRAGAVLCGGCSRIPEIVPLAEKVFQMPVTVGHAGAVSALAKSLDGPEFATAIGLVKYGSLRQRNPVARPSWWTGFMEFIKALFAFQK